MLQEQLGKTLNSRIQNITNQCNNLLNNGDSEPNEPIIEAVLKLMIIDYMKQNFKDTSQIKDSFF